MTDLSRLKFFSTHPHPCSYIKGREATTLFLDPHQPVEEDVYAALSDLGFRRSGEHLYRPHCSPCQDCIPARIPVGLFTPTRQQRKIFRRNADLQVSATRPQVSDEYFELYARYIECRHANGDMYPPDRSQLASFLARDLPFCTFFEFRLDGRLLAVAVTDILPNGLSAIYTFFDPDEERRSLGRYCILWQIEETRRRGLDGLYLGYWIRDCRKMRYKTEYRPLELLIQRQWRLLT